MKLSVHLISLYYWIPFEHTHAKHLCQMFVPETFSVSNPLGHGFGASPADS